MNRGSLLRAAIHRASRAVVSLASLVVHRDARDDWRREWLAELASCQHQQQRWRTGSSPVGGELRCLKRAALAWRDAWNLRRSASGPPRRPSRRATALLRMAAAGSELKHAARRLRRAPAAALNVIVVLALGIGTSASMAGISRSLLFEPVLATAPGELVRVYTRLSSGFEWAPMSWGEVTEYALAKDGLVGLAAEAYVPLAIDQDGVAVRSWGAVVTGDYFEVLGLRPRIGRLLQRDDDRIPGGHPVAVISAGFWERRFGGDERVIGREIRINRTTFTIVGVAPSGFSGINRGADPVVWLPAMMHAVAIPGADWIGDRHTGELWPIARLRRGATIEGVRQELEAIFAGLAEADPGGYERQVGVNVIPEVEGGIHPYYRGYFVQFASIFAGAVAMLLVLACANASGLMVAMGSSRRRETAIRRALGATRLQIWRFALAEAVLLGGAATAVGIGAAGATLAMMSRFQPPTDVPVNMNLTLGSESLIVALAVSVLAALGAGALPAAAAASAAPADLLRHGGLGDRPTGRWQRRIVVAQVALSTVLLLGTALLVRALNAASSIDPGFDPEGVAVVSVDLDLAGYDAAQGRSVHDRLLLELDRTQIVEAAALSDWLPFPVDPRGIEIAPQGWNAPDGLPEFAAYASVSPGFHEVLGIPLIDGRPFGVADDERSRGVAIVNATFVSRYWPGENALGREVLLEGSPHIVVGVAADAKYRSLAEDPLAFVYVPLRQSYAGVTHVLARSGAPPGEVLDAVRRVIAAVDPQLPAHAARPMSATFGLALLPARIGSSFLGFFGLLASVLAATGLYGVLAYNVACRRREIGTRIALGAGSREISRMILRDSGRLVGAGVVLGLPLALAGGRLLSGLLYGVGFADPAALFISVAIIGATAALASAVPARRAARVDPRTSMTG